MTDHLDLAALATRHQWPGYECDSCGDDGFTDALLAAVLTHMDHAVVEQLAANVCREAHERRRLRRWGSAIESVCWRRMQAWQREQSRIREEARRAALSPEERDAEDAQWRENEAKLFAAFESIVKPPLDSGSMHSCDVVTFPASGLMNLLHGLKGQRK